MRPDNSMDPAEAVDMEHPEVGSGCGQGVTIGLVDDHRLFRSCLRVFLESIDRMQVVGEAENGRDAIAMVSSTCPDLVLMDIAMPHLNGIESTRQILRRREAGGKPRVMALTMHSRGEYIQEMLRAGASGYLLKTCSTSELVRAVETVARGHTYLAPEIAHAVVSGYVSDRADGPEQPELTAREKEVLQLVAEGYPSKNIATELNVSIKTVESHRQRVMVKLGIHSIAELTKYALREGITSLEA